MEQERLYEEAQRVGIVLSQGLKTDPLLDVLVARVTDDVIYQRKTVFPIFFTKISSLYPLMEQFTGVQLYSDAENDEQKRAEIFRQLQKLIRWLK